MLKGHYFMGANFVKDHKIQFAPIGPSRGIPYQSRDSYVATQLYHMNKSQAHLYILLDDTDVALLVRDSPEANAAAPEQIKLVPKLQNAIRTTKEWTVPKCRNSG